MTIDDQIRDEKLQYDINREVAKISALSFENQREKQIQAIQNQGHAKTVKKHTYNDEDNPLISKQKEIFNKLIDERLDEITKLGEKVNLDDLIYRCKGKTPDGNFDRYDNDLNLINKIKNG